MAFLVVSGGCVRVNLCDQEPNNSICHDEADMGRDMSVDANRDAAPVDMGVDLGPCGLCSGTTPYCRSASEAGAAQCVACTTNLHCNTSGADGGASTRPFCDVTRGQCVACLANTDCPANTPVCSAGVCGGCTADSQCSARMDSPVCDETTGRCVGCTADRECTNGHVCHPTALTCTAAAPGSVDFCEQCVSDSECATGYRCVPMEYRDAPRNKSYCLRVRVGAEICPPQMASPRERTSTGTAGTPASPANYCVPREAITTCEAIKGISRPCTPDSSPVDAGTEIDASADAGFSDGSVDAHADARASDASAPDAGSDAGVTADMCGDPTISDDGTCLPQTGGGGLCSYPCGAPSDCLGGGMSSCFMGYCRP